MPIQKTEGLLAGAILRRSNVLPAVHALLVVSTLAQCTNLQQGAKAHSVKKNMGIQCPGSQDPPVSSLLGRVYACSGAGWKACRICLQFSPNSPLRSQNNVKKIGWILGPNCQFITLALDNVKWVGQILGPDCQFISS